jgi:hypothetical protein
MILARYGLAKSEKDRSEITADWARGAMFFIDMKSSQVHKNPTDC